MKPIIFAVFFIGLALNARAQLNQQVDTVPSTQGGWVIINSGTTAGFIGLSWPTKDTVWATAQDGLHRSTDGGWTWQLVAGVSGPIIFRTGSNGILASGSDRVLHTTNAGQTWDTLRTGLVPGNPIIAWPSEDTILSAGDGFVSRSTDGGQSWTKESYPGGNIAAFGFATNSVGYAVGDFQSCYNPHNGQTLIGSLFLETTDAGATWNQICNIVPQQSFFRIACYNPATLIVVGSYKIYRSSSSGSTWDSISPGLSPGDEFYSIAIHDSICYASAVSGAFGTGHPIFMSVDSGNSWNKISVPINRLMLDVKIFDDTDIIMVGDTGTILRHSTSSSGISNPPKDTLSLQLFPDPAQQTLSVQYTLPQQQTVTLSVFDANGNLISVPLHASLQPTGTETVSVSTSSLASGSYFIQMNSANYYSTIPFTITH